MSKQAKKYIQQAAWDRFPANELWIRPDDRFWAFDIESNVVTCTDGLYKDNDIIFQKSIHRSENPEQLVETLIEKKRSEGYVCFAIQLRV